MMPSDKNQREIQNPRFKILGSYFIFSQKGGEEIDEREEKTTIPVPSYSALKVLYIGSVWYWFSSFYPTLVGRPLSLFRLR